MSDGDFGRAYVMLYRHSVLVLDKLRRHPQYKNPTSRSTVHELSKRMEGVIADLEKIKPILREEYEEWERSVPKQLKIARPPQPRPPSTYVDFAAQDPSVTGNATVLDAAENQDLAVELAKKELTRRDHARQANRHAKVYGDTILSPSLNNGQRIDMDLQGQMEAARRATARPQQEWPQDPSGGESGPYIPSQPYVYPTILQSKPVRLDELPSRPPPEPSRPPPKRPPKEYEQLPPPGTAYEDDDSLPVPPPKVATRETSTTYLSSYGPERQPPLPPKGHFRAPLSPKKERLAFKPGAYLENGDPIRSVFLPQKLRAAFLDIASDNTRKGLEMCGILCGTPVNNALFVRCLLIPDQKCTSDTCETENESAIFDYCAGEDLLVLGWIHTHPTQTCFMSSRDLHTHAGYQVMMPESIAIVCAPRFKPSYVHPCRLSFTREANCLPSSYGIFRLTHPPGLEHILECRQSDTFHQHSISNLYRETEHPNGHVYESDKMPFDVKDLRHR